MFQDTTERDLQVMREMRTLDRGVQKYGSSFPMVARCFEAQWRGLEEAERLLREESLKPGYEVDDTSSHQSHPLWWVASESARMEPWQTILMCVKTEQYIT